MRKFLVASALLLCLPGVLFADQYIQGYTRNDGTSVQPHYRSNPDSNPYTGKQATGNPDAYLKQYNHSNGFESSHPSGSGRSLYGGR